jgi:hypothetical protein
MVIGTAKRDMQCNQNDVELVSLDPVNHPVPTRLQKLGRFTLTGKRAKLFSGSIREFVLFYCKYVAKRELILFISSNIFSIHQNSPCNRRTLHSTRVP